MSEKQDILFIGKVLFLNFIDPRVVQRTGYVACRLNAKTGFPAGGGNYFQRLDDLITQFRILKMTNLDIEFEAPKGIQERNGVDDDNQKRRFETLKLEDIHRVSIALSRN